MPLRYSSYVMLLGQLPRRNKLRGLGYAITSLGYNSLLFSYDM